MIKKTIMTFDFGTNSIGVAIGQEITTTARPLTTIKVKDSNPNWVEINKILQDWHPKLIIVGLPLNMDGTEQIISNKARKFAYNLEWRFGIKVILHDERLTTVEARSKLFNYGGYRALNKKKIDSFSAVIILESWFEQNI
ncbi:Putative Holliday junction resolvase [Candidatus Arsenophonus lipoptenae]|uniref:Putative pre-16S rRNA nuclease n=1 Tax=Candidatus Arsenophonus lipoptenae TaxID=634113 RepID=A0A0X9W664_9GAMM|nr:Holliday junction resolvase RuvX [Candidatus Arsenophonus lipoptenae]AMA64747.1 Putative Holliday junction resolvase [Candidatus Arsenophonus lipoptenae]